MKLLVLAVFFFLMIPRPPRSTRTDTLFPTRRSSDLLASSSQSKFLKLLGVKGDGAAPAAATQPAQVRPVHRSEEHTSELQSLMRTSYAVFCLTKKKTQHNCNYVYEE